MNEREFSPAIAWVPHGRSLTVAVLIAVAPIADS